MKGFTLIELMIAVGIIAIIAAVGFPAYTGYIESARVSVMSDSIQTIRLMQDERRRDRGEYVQGTYVPGGANTLTARLGWSPDANTDLITYVIVCVDQPPADVAAGECNRTSGYTVTATHAQSTGDPISRTYTP